MRTIAFAFSMAALMLGAGGARAQVNCGPQNDQCTITKYGLGTKPDFRFDKVPLEAHLFDLDNDGRIELEITDTDGDGVFETRRPVSYPIPAFLIPPG